MCEECLVSQPTLAQALQPFLREGVRVAVLYDDRRDLGAEDLYLEAADGSYLVITAEGDEGGYFHWEVPESDEPLSSRPDLGANVVRLADYR